METSILFIFLVFATLNLKGTALPLTGLGGTTRKELRNLRHDPVHPQTFGRKSRQFEDGDDEEEDEEDETTVKGPGHEGILNGLSGILKGVVSGNANSVVESSFNFVPPVYQKEVSNFYGGIIGRTTTQPTTPRPVPPSTPALAQATSSALQHGSDEEGEAGEKDAPPAWVPLQPVKSSPISRIRPRPRPAPVLSRPIVDRPFSSGDDEEDAKKGL